jgi:ferredoxin
MRVAVDLRRCQGNGVCEKEAPEVFAVQEEGTVVVLLDEPDARLHRPVREAARRCPTRAITVDP